MNDTPDASGSTTTFPSFQATSLSNLKATAGNGWYYDASSKRLYLRITLQPAFLPWMGSGFLPILSGREVIVEVDA